MGNRPDALNATAGLSWRAAGRARGVLASTEKEASRSPSMLAARKACG